MAAETATTVNDRVQTVLNSANVTSAINNHAGLLDGLAGTEVKLFSFAIADGDFEAGSGAKTIDCGVISATQSCYVLDVAFELEEVFAGGSLSACTCSIGNDDVPDPDAYVLAQDVFTGASLDQYGYKASEQGALLATATRSPFVPPNKSITATFTPTDDDMENATSGAITVYVWYRLI